MNWDDRLQYVALTDIGMRRANNQDSYAVVLASDSDAWNRRGHFFMVADGMGAHAAGELASKLAVDGVPHLYYKYHDLTPREALEKAILETNSEVHRRGQANSDFYNMGTTASALVLLPQSALVAQIGDSRVYRLRSNRLEQLTRDHSLIWELRDHLAGSSDLAIPKNVITRSLGPNASVLVDIEGPFPMETGDVFLVCSDGLTGRVSDEELATILRDFPPEEAGHLLIDLANLRGGPDNITVLLAKAVGDDWGTKNPEPARTETPRAPTTFRPAIWVCAAVCLLGAMVLGITNNPIPALVAAFGAGVALLVALLSRYQRKPRGGPVSGGPRRRSGPYTETPCPSHADAVKMMRRIASELRSSISSIGLPVDWPKYDLPCQAGEQSHDTTHAMRCYAQALHELMRQIRETLNKQAGDSSIEF